MVRHKVTQCMQAVHNLGKVFLLVQICQFKAEAIWKSDLVNKLEVVVDIVRVTELQLRVHKDPRHTRWFKGLGELGKRNAIPHLLCHVRNVAAQRLSNAPLHPLLSLTAVTQVLVCLNIIAFLLEPLASATKSAYTAGVLGHGRKDTPSP